MPKVFVCFIGTDGSGKSTLAANVFDGLKKRKENKVIKIYGRHQPFFTKLIIKLGRKVFLNRHPNMFSDYDRYLDDKRSFYKTKSKVVALYMTLLKVEYCCQVLFKLVIPYKLGYSIIADRYVYDTVINDLAIDKDLSTVEAKEMLTRFWSFMPKPDLTFLIQVPEETAFKRKNDIPSLNYLKLRNAFYSEIAKSENIIVLDGTRDQLELQSVVLEKIDELDR